MSESFFVVGVAFSLLLAWIGMRYASVGGGVLGFVAGCALTGIVASSQGIKLDSGCDRYSHFASDC